MAKLTRTLVLQQMEFGICFCFCFFFQAEDGIRDIGVTGVQTCALPICPILHQSCQIGYSKIHNSIKLTRFERLHGRIRELRIYGDIIVCFGIYTAWKVEKFSVVVPSVFLLAFLYLKMTVESYNFWLLFLR